MKHSPRETLWTASSLIVLVALTYIIAKWPAKTAADREDEYYFISGPGMSCVAHKSPYALQCVPRMTGA